MSHFVIPVALCNKKAVALCNNRPSHFVITLVALCNKLEIDGRRTSKPSSVIMGNNNNDNNDSKNDNNNNNNNNNFFLNKTKLYS